MHFDELTDGKDYAYPADESTIPEKVHYEIYLDEQPTNTDSTSSKDVAIEGQLDIDCNYENFQVAEKRK